MSKQFYVGLSDDAVDQSSVALLRHALNELRDDAGDDNIKLSHFNLESEYTDDGKPSIFVQYDVMDDQDMDTRSRAMELARDTRLAHELPEEEMLGDIAKLCRLVVRLPHGEQQDNDYLLIERLISSLEGYAPSAVYDVVYHQFCDDDGLDHPFFSAYFRS